MNKKDQEQCSPFTGPLLGELVKQDKANFERNFSNPSVGQVPLAPPDLYQDAGGGYNANLTFPQK